MTPRRWSFLSSPLFNTLVYLGIMSFFLYTTHRMTRRFQQDKQPRSVAYDFEWISFKLNIYTRIVLLLIHSISLQLVNKFISTQHFQLVTMAVIDFSLLVYSTSFFTCILLTLTDVTFSFIILNFRSKTLVWLLGVLYIKYGMNMILTLAEGGTVEHLLSSYTFMKLISYGIYLCDNPQVPFCSHWQMAVSYFTYLPYDSTVIVTYNDFQQQTRLRYNQKRQWTLKTALRVLGFILSYIALELMYRKIHLNCVCPRYSMKNVKDIYEGMAIAFLIEYVFWLKYFIMFGMPSVFAEFDGMEIDIAPKTQSILFCSTTTCFRTFDIGFHQFSKQHIFKPTLETIPSFIGSKLIATILSFSATFIWHEGEELLTEWLSMTILTIVLEQTILPLLKGNTTATTIAKAFLGPLTVIGGTFFLCPGLVKSMYSSSALHSLCSATTFYLGAIITCYFTQQFGKMINNKLIKIE